MVGGIIKAFLASLAGVALWLIITLWLGFMGGLAGAVMGGLYVIVYKKCDYENKSPLPYIIGAILILGEIVFSELYSLFIVVKGIDPNMTLAEAWSLNRTGTASLLQMGIGVIVAAIAFLAFLLPDRKNQQKPKQNKQP